MRLISWKIILRILNDFVIPFVFVLVLNRRCYNSVLKTKRGAIFWGPKSFACYIFGKCVFCLVFSVVGMQIKFNKIKF